MKTEGLLGEVNAVTMGVSPVGGLSLKDHTKPSTNNSIFPLLTENGAWNGICENLRRD